LNVILLAEVHAASGVVAVEDGEACASTGNVDEIHWVVDNGFYGMFGKGEWGKMR
jgi:hypothetical protein